jgi:serine/threonine-protein kinase RsbT
MLHSTRILIIEEVDIAEARRAALLMATDLGLKRTAAYYVATAVSELASNMLHHAGGGEIRLSVILHQGRTGIEVIAQDGGPGIADMKLALCDGFSTSGGLGCGLPGARRLMDELEIDSEVGRGTRIVARKWAVAIPQNRDATPSYPVAAH